MSEAIEQPLFVKRRHELSTLLRQVGAGTPEAVELLIATMSSTDKDVTLKMRVDCANRLIDLQVQIASEISRDQITRQIAEFKAKGLSTPLEVHQHGTSKRLPPKTDFLSIQEI